MSVDPTPAGSRRDAKITIKYVSPYRELMPIAWPADHTLVFTHIPKAAGTTLDSILEDIAADDGLKWLRVMGTLYGQFLGPGKPDTVAELDDLSDQALSAAQFLTGHIPFGVDERIEGKCFYITVLREPASRLLSHFRYGVERGGWSAATAIEDLLRDGLVIDNPQTRQLAGLRDAAEKCTPATLERALSNLKSGYAIVGVTERFDEVLKALIGLYGWPDLAYTDCQVTTARIGGDVESKVAEAAGRYDELDRELYAWAASRETPWTDGLFAGAARGTTKQNQVLLTSSILHHYRGQLSSNPSFQSIARQAAANGDAVEFV
jgi:hypothetical protein